MREIVMDTETTGLDFRTGDRLIEIGCIEIVNRYPTGQEFHRFINPLRDVPQEAVNVHGLTADFLKDKPLFQDVAGAFLEFIGQDVLVIHNATFDVGFLNFELEKVGLPTISMSRVVDTLALARRKHPAGPNNLDALCKRYGIDNTKRTKHGAIVDSELLAEVYVELLGERQAALGLQAESVQTTQSKGGRRSAAAARPQPLAARIDATARTDHRAYIETMTADAVWRKFWS